MWNVMETRCIYISTKSRPARHAEDKRALSKVSCILNDFRHICHLIISQITNNFYCSGLHQPVIHMEIDFFDPLNHMFSSSLSVYDFECPQNCAKEEIFLILVLTEISLLTS